MDQGAINSIKKTIEIFEEELAKMIEEANGKKQVINALYMQIGQNPIYEMEDEAKKTQNIGRSQFYGKSFVGAVREFLEMRNEPCTLEEIYEGLKEGAFDFQWKEKDQFRMVSISISKNSYTFHKLPNDTIGLLDWYPEIKKKKRGGNNNFDNEQNESSVNEDEKSESINGQQQSRRNGPSRLSEVESDENEREPELDPDPLSEI